jgi:DNA-binding MarR family transcriptional regulator
MKDEQDLSDFERRVFEVIRNPEFQLHDPRGVSFEEICAYTLLSPDIVTKVIAELVQADLVLVVGQTDPSDLRLTAELAR